MNLRKKYLKIPVELCRFALEERMSRTVQIYTHLNLNSSGKLTLDSDLLGGLCNALSLHTKTLKTHLEILNQKNWIGYNPVTGRTYIRGIDKIRELEGFYRNIAAEIRKDDIPVFKEFCIAAFVGYLINLQRQKRWRSERLQSRSFHECHQQITEYDSVSLNVLADLLKISKSTAHRYLLSAEDAGYLTIKPHFTDISHYRKDASILMRLNPRVKLIDDHLVLQGPNEIDHSIYFRHRKIMEPYNSHPRSELKGSKQKHNGNT